MTLNDFFGYLATGLLVTVGLDLLLGGPDILGRDLKPVQAALLIVAIYVFGQLIATPAKAILEDLVIDKLLHRPSINLFRQTSPRMRRALFPGYYKPLPRIIQHRILTKARSEGIHSPGEELFIHVRYTPEIRQDDKLIAELDSFRDKYGFSRNVAFTLLLVGFGLGVKAALARSLPGAKLAGL